MLKAFGKELAKNYMAQHGNAKNADIKRLKNFIFDVYEYMSHKPEYKALTIIGLTTLTIGALTPIFKYMNEKRRIDNEFKLKRYKIDKEMEIKIRTVSIHDKKGDK